MHSKTFIAAALAALALASAPALAAQGLSGSSITGLGGAAGATSSIFNFDVSNISSWDGEGDASNLVFTISIGAGSRVVGIGWDVTITAIAPSYLSEASVLFGSSSNPFEVVLTPGTDENPGTASYASEGIVDLIGPGFNFNVDGDGLLRLEFFEVFDDDKDVVDATWLSGNLAIEVVAVPEPSTYGMMALGLLAVGAAARRRKA